MDWNNCKLRQENRIKTWDSFSTLSFFFYIFCPQKIFIPSEQINEMSYIRIRDHVDI